MTRKTRYFVLGAGAVLVIGLGGALIAYLAYDRGAAVPHGLPPEVRFVPANAAIVAFADVQGVMNSELRRSLAPGADDMRRGRELNNFVGVDLEKQVNRIVAYIEPNNAADSQSQAPSAEMPRALILVQGTFDTGRIEAAIVERAGAMEEYKGRKVFVHHEGNHELALGLVQPDLIAMGQA